MARGVGKLGDNQGAADQCRWEVSYDCRTLESRQLNKDCVRVLNQQQVEQRVNDMTRRPPSTIPLIDVYSQTFASLNGKTVVVTGGSSGIGLECGKLFNSLGADVVLGDVQPPRGEAASWISQSARVKYIPCDITDWESLSNFFEAAKSISGRIHVVCANAGINEMGDAFRPLERDERLRAPDLRTLNVNLGGAILTVSCAFQHLAAGGGGSIVMTSSMAGYLGVPEMPIYAATKHGMSRLSNITLSVKRLESRR